MTPLQPAGVGRAADEVVALVGRDHEQRVLPGDAVGGQPCEERAERGVLGPQLVLVSGLAGPERGAGLPRVVQVAQVRVGDRDAVQLHVEGVGQRVRAGHAVIAREPDVPAGVLDHGAVQVPDRPGRADDRLDERAAVQRLVPVVAAGLAGQHVGPPAVGADPGAPGAVHGQALEVGCRLVLQLGVLRLPGLGRRGPEHQRDVRGGVLQLGVGPGDRAEVAARPGVGHPGRRGAGAALGDHAGTRVAHRRAGGGVVVDDGVGPVRERARRVGGAVRLVVVVLVRDRHALVTAVPARLGRDDVVGRVRDQRGVLVADQGALAGEEAQQVGHLLQVAGHIRVVPGEVHVVELHVDDVADLPARAEHAAARAARGALASGQARGRAPGGLPGRGSRRRGRPRQAEHQGPRCTQREHRWNDLPDHATPPAHHAGHPHRMTRAPQRSQAPVRKLGLNAGQ